LGACDATQPEYNWQRGYRLSYISPVYRVQLGAFSMKSTAENLLTKPMMQVFSGYITMGCKY